MIIEIMVVGEKTLPFEHISHPSLPPTTTTTSSPLSQVDAERQAARRQRVEARQCLAQQRQASSSPWDAWLAS